MIFGPMTMIVAAALIACLCAGVALLIRAKSDRSKPVCGKCHQRNPQGATFCAACGEELTE